MKTRHAALAALFLGLIGLEIAHGVARVRGLEDRERQSLLERVRRGQVELSGELKRSLEETRAHALYLARSRSVRALLDDGAGPVEPVREVKRHALAEELRPYVLSFGGIDGVSILDAAGIEQGKAERIGRGVGSIPAPLLARDADFGLLSLARGLKPATVAISGIMHDSRRVEVPADDRLVLYFVAPVDSPSRRLGYVALSAYAAPILQRVRSFAPAPGVVTCLVDASGQYLAHPDRSREKGRPRPGSLIQDVGAAVSAQILAGAAEAEAKDTVLVALPVAASEPAWRLVSHIGPVAFEQAIAGLSAEYTWAAALMLIVTVLLAIAGFFLVRMSVREVELREEARFRRQREELERRMAVSERLGSLGLLTAGVAHEINNPLEGIENYLTLLERERDSDDKRKRYIDMVRHGFHRIRDIVRDLSAFSRPGVETGTLDLGAAVRQALRMVSYTKELKQVAVEVEGLDAALLVPGDARRLEQVFINLLLNAARAMNGEGRITIAARAAADRDSAGWIEVTIDDSGPGIPADVLPRIFDPFFTTTDGTGLGLSICFGILQAHGGTIKAENRDAGGARFVLTLPASPPLVAVARKEKNERNQR